MAQRDWPPEVAVPELWAGVDAGKALRERKGRNSAAVARLAVTAAEAQFTVVPAEATAAAMVARLAKGVMALDEEIAETDALIEDRFRRHRHAAAVLGMPGVGPLLGAEFVALTGGDMAAFGSADRLAGVAGPVPKDSGQVRGNLRRPRRHNRRLLRMSYLSAQVAARCCPTSKAFYDRKRREGKAHKQAVPAPARRRLNLLQALIRDNRTMRTGTPQPEAAAA